MSNEFIIAMKYSFSILMMASLFFIVSCNSVTSTDAKNSHAIPPLIQELKVIDTLVGEGKAAMDDSFVAMHYSGWLYDDAAEDKKGKMFDTSHDLGDPLAFQLGTNRVIKGWDVGIVGMKVGGKRVLHIPAHLAYGDKRIGTVRTAIPANSALVFDVELVDLN